LLLTCPFQLIFHYYLILLPLSFCCSYSFCMAFVLISIKKIGHNIVAFDDISWFWSEGRNAFFHFGVWWRTLFFFPFVLGFFSQKNRFWDGFFKFKNNNSLLLPFDFTLMCCDSMMKEVIYIYISIYIIN